MGIEPVLENEQPDLFEESAVPYGPARPDKTPPGAQPADTLFELDTRFRGPALRHDGRAL